MYKLFCVDLHQLVDYKMQSNTHTDTQAHAMPPWNIAEGQLQSFGYAGVERDGNASLYTYTPRDVAAANNMVVVVRTGPKGRGLSKDLADTNNLGVGVRTGPKGRGLSKDLADTNNLAVVVRTGPKGRGLSYDLDKVTDPSMKRRLEKNRASAAASRLKRAQYVAGLEHEVQELRQKLLESNIKLQRTELQLVAVQGECRNLHMQMDAMRRVLTAYETPFQGNQHHSGRQADQKATHKYTPGYPRSEVAHESFDTLLNPSACEGLLTVSDQQQMTRTVPENVDFFRGYLYNYPSVEHYGEGEAVEKNVREPAPHPYDGAEDIGRL